MSRLTPTTSPPVSATVVDANQRPLPDAIREAVHEANHSRPGTCPPIRFRVFANDCGLRNYGYALIEVVAERTKNGEWHVSFNPLDHGINRNVIDNVRDPTMLANQQREYLRWLAGKINHQAGDDGFKTVVFAAERYMMRRGSGSLTVELVGFMLGTASLFMSRLRQDQLAGVGEITYDGRIPVVLFPASSWKNAFARRYQKDTLDAVYTTVKRKWKEDKVALTEHQVDAYLQAVWVAHRLLGFEGVQEYAHLHRDFIQHLVSTAPTEQQDVRAGKAPPSRKALAKKRMRDRQRIKNARAREKAKQAKLAAKHRAKQQRRSVAR